MVHLPRNAPQTPLDTLRALLAEYSAEDASFQGKLLHLLQAHRRQIFRELGSRLAQTTTPKGLRRTILALIPKFDWPEWTPSHLPGSCSRTRIWASSTRAARPWAFIANREAYEALKQLQALRNDPDRQVILNRELNLFQPQQPVGYYLSRLMEGQGNTKLAAQGAKILSGSAGPEDLPALVEAHRSGDALTQRLAMRIIASLRTPEATDYLLETLEQTRQEFVDLQQVMEIQRRTQNMGRGIREAGIPAPGPGALRGPGFPRSRTAWTGPTPWRARRQAPNWNRCGRRPRGCSTGSSWRASPCSWRARWRAIPPTSPRSPNPRKRRSPQLTRLCDQAAEALAYRVDLGLVPFAEVRPAFLEAFRVRLGGDGFIQAFLRLLPAEETEILDELLARPGSDPAPALPERPGQPGRRCPGALLPEGHAGFHRGGGPAGHPSSGQAPFQLPGPDEALRIGPARTGAPGHPGLRREPDPAGGGAPGGLHPEGHPRRRPGGSRGGPGQHPLPRRRPGGAGHAPRRQAPEPAAGPGPRPGPDGNRGGLPGPACRNPPPSSSPRCSSWPWREP